MGRVTRARTIEELTPHLEAWDDLAAHTIEPNVFYERWMLLPAIEHLSARERPEVALVHDDDDRLIGLVPIVRPWRFRGLPIPHFRAWHYIHCYLCTPLVRAGHESACFSALLDGLGGGPAGLFLELRYCGGGGRFDEALEAFVASNGTRLRPTATRERAFLQSDASADEYLRGTYKRKHRMELERHVRRLRERGTLETNVIMGSGDVDGWVDRFLDLESRGWKGRKGTALAATEDDQTFFRRMLDGASERGQVFLLEMTLDGEPIAMQANVLASRGEASFSFKIAFDERYAQYSPGVLLQLENLRIVLPHERIAWMDSCAAPDHPMINRLWQQRRTIRNVNITTNHPLSGVTINAVAAMVAAYRRLRGER